MEKDMMDEDLGDPRKLERQAIYDIQVVFDADHGKISDVHFLMPDVTRIEFVFHTPSRDYKFQPHFVKEMLVTFDSGQTYSMDGINLWKFLDRVPENLSLPNDPYEYRPDNIYSLNYTPSEMAKVIREVFIYLSKPHDINDETKPLSKFTIEFKSDTYSTTERLINDLPANLKETLLPSYDQALTPTLAQKKQIGEWVRKSLMKPRVEQKFVRVGDGLRNQFTEVPWPDVSDMTFAQFLNEFDPETHGSPIYSTYHARFGTMTSEWDLAAMRDVIDDLPGMDSMSYSYLIIFCEMVEAEETGAEELAKIVMNNPVVELPTLSADRWYERICETTIGEIVKF